ncbi:MAG: protease [Thermoprotei archaeon]|nr:MAG: protease [Thermoprotei archaeon]
MLWWLWIYDPLTMIAMIVAYAVGYAALLFIASIIAPRVAKKLTNKFSLYSSMAIAMATILVSGLAGIFIISWILVQVSGLTLGFVWGLVLFIVIMNVFTYLVSPYMINLMYGAEYSYELQEIVNRVASRAGIKKPPKAVIVRGPPNAFAYGNFITGKYVAITTGMLKIVNQKELEAVIGHELGHHRHKDTVIMLLLGIIPSVLYYLGIVLIRAGLLGGAASSKDRRGGGGLPVLLVGIGAIVLSFILQILVLAFSRLREYYADAHGALVAGNKNMQRALAKLYLYYDRYERAQEYIRESKLRTLFIYALLDALANPLVPYIRYYGYHGLDRLDRHIDVDKAIEEIKRRKVHPAVELLSSHPPIPKRLAFLDRVVIERVKP